MTCLTPELPAVLLDLHPVQLNIVDIKLMVSAKLLRLFFLLLMKFLADFLPFAFADSLLVVRTDNLKTHRNLFL